MGELVKVRTPGDEGQPPGDQPQYDAAKSAQKAAEQTGMSLGAFLVAVAGVIAASPAAQEAAGAYFGNVAAVALVFMVIRFALGWIRDRQKHRAPDGTLRAPLSKV